MMRVTKERATCTGEGGTCTAPLVPRSRAGERRRQRRSRLEPAAAACETGSLESRRGRRGLRCHATQNACLEIQPEDAFRGCVRARVPTTPPPPPAAFFHLKSDKAPQNESRDECAGATSPRCLPEMVAVAVGGGGRRDKGACRVHARASAQRLGTHGVRGG
ncbi:unnamed protein product [Lampetra planeri]